MTTSLKLASSKFESLNTAFLKYVPINFADWKSPPTNIVKSRFAKLKFAFLKSTFLKLLRLKFVAYRFDENKDELRKLLPSQLTFCIFTYDRSTSWNCTQCKSHSLKFACLKIMFSNLELVKEHFINSHEEKSIPFNEILLKSYSEKSSPDRSNLTSCPKEENNFK